MNTEKLHINRLSSTPVERILDHFGDSMNVIAGHQGIGRRVYVGDLNRPDPARIAFWPSAVPPPWLPMAGTTKGSAARRLR